MHAFQTTMAPFYYNPLFFVVVFLPCLILPLSEGAKNGGVTVDLIHRDSPLSPFYDPSESQFERLRKSFDRSISRYLMKKSTNKMVSPVSSNGGEYLMKIGVGTPPVQVLAIADTGSDLTWTQCEPCTKCYNQAAPPFNPTKTSSYKSVPCTSRQCQALGSRGSSCDTSNACLYQVSYGDNSYSSGNLAVETFTFDAPDSGNSTTFPDVVFGCGHDNGGSFDPKGTGIVGLGGGALSIVRQLNTSVGGRFSYCLTSLNSNVTSRISFGSDAVVEGPNVSTTPLLKKEVDTFYYLTLEGISVGNDKLEYKVVPKQPVERGNIIIDSGTTLSLLPTEFYGRLEAALSKAVNGTKRVPDPQGTFQLCYQTPSNGGLASPPIMMHFTGADVAVSEESVFVEVEKGVVCLTFVPSDSLGMAIFGNLHQINHVVGYDLVDEKISFLPSDCSRAQ